MVRVDQIDELFKTLQARDLDSAWNRLQSSASADRAATRPRVISPEAGRALEILGHAIDYLVDEYVHAGGGFCEGDPEYDAIRILMAANRAIYFSCPIRPTFFERLFKKLGQLGL